MTLLSGIELDPKRFFRDVLPEPKASSFDLTIGRIYNRQGHEVDGPFTLRPGQMVQVVSAEVFNLGNDVTGHVTYKTSLTRIGIWALTVGIVDPGWTAPIGTTLLNFGRNDYTVQAGEPFLRVSFFQHKPVSDEMLRESKERRDYHKEVQKLAASQFPLTFLNREEIAQSAGAAVLNRIRKEALAWVGLIALIFAVIQIGARLVPVPLDLTAQAQMKAELAKVNADLDALKSALGELRQSR